MSKSKSNTSNSLFLISICWTPFHLPGNLNKLFSHLMPKQPYAVIIILTSQVGKKAQEDNSPKPGPWQAKHLNLSLTTLRTHAPEWSRWLGIFSAASSTPYRYWEGAQVPRSLPAARENLLCVQIRKTLFPQNVRSSWVLLEADCENTAN